MGKEMNLLAIDPGGNGGHTGIVLIEFGVKTPATLVESWAIPGDARPFYEWATLRPERLLNIDVLVCEKFVNRNVPGADLTPLRVEGALEAVWHKGVVWQPASGKNTAVPDKALKNLGLFFEGSGDHHHDRREASRHAVVYLKKKRHMPTLKAGWPPSA